MTPLPILNIAAYKFVELGDLGRRRRELREFCRGNGLRGTILLSEEGINLFLAGSDQAVDSLLELLQNDPAIGQLDVKRSRSVDIPFRRMLVKVKREIISFDVPGVDPIHTPAPKISAKQLKQWLDEGRELALLDVRNDYEVEVGTFEGAHALGIGHFRHFPQAVHELPEELQRQPIVMFCTGGIRCEKAGPMMQQAGFQNVVQLDGGILKYFEECGGAHYEGDCFVFDQRVALDHHLQETETTICFACQAVLSVEDQASPKYVPPESCPHCYRTPDVRMSELIQRRKQQIRVATTPMPGSVAYENRRPLNVPEKYDGFELLALLSTMHPHVAQHDWVKWIGEGQFVRDHETLSTSTLLRAGERIEHVEAETIEPDINPDIAVIHEDAMLVVVNKPAPLPMHPCGRFNRNTLTYIMDKVYAPQRLRIAHRLDANTTGVVILSRTKNVAALVQPQFEQGKVQKRYVAQVHGLPEPATFRCDAAIVAKSGQSGARQVGPSGQRALTEFDLIADLGDGTSLVEARPITGRTNQIRIHLAHLGLPIVGDQLYRGQQLGDRQTLDPSHRPLCLHARSITLEHPEDRRAVEFSAPLPTWAERAAVTV